MRKKGRREAAGVRTRGWRGVLIRKIEFRFPEPIMRRPEGRGRFHLGLKLKALSPLLALMNLRIGARASRPALAGIPRRKTRFIIVYVVRRKTKLD